MALPVVLGVRGANLSRPTPPTAPRLKENTMSRTITRMFDTFADAERAATELERLGVPHSDISLIGRDEKRVDREPMSFERTPEEGHSEAARDAGKGAGAGAVVGGAGGLLAGLGMFAIPGIGPVVGAGWLTATLIGAAAGAAVGGAAGGIVGALTKAGVPEDEANVYAEGVRRGGTIVSARVDDSQAAEAEAALDRFNAVTAADRAATYRQEGWTRFDETATEADRDRPDAI